MVSFKDFSFSSCTFTFPPYSIFMRRIRVQANPIQKLCKRKGKDKQSQAVSWVKKEVRLKRSWTRHAVPFSKLCSIYNLRPNAFEHIRLLYRTGREESNGVPALVPRQLNYIRQDILAYYFILSTTFLRMTYELSRTLLRDET